MKLRILFLMIFAFSLQGNMLNAENAPLSFKRTPEKSEKVVKRSKNVIKHLQKLAGELIKMLDDFEKDRLSELLLLSTYLVSHSSKKRNCLCNYGVSAALALLASSKLAALYQRWDTAKDSQKLYLAVMGVLYAVAFYGNANNKTIF